MDNEKFQEFIADQFTKLFSEFQGLKQDVSGLKEDVSGLKQDVSELKEDVSGLKQDVSQLKEDVSGLKQDVSQLKSDVAIIKVDLIELKESQIRLESDFHNQITALHDFRVSQEQVNQATKGQLVNLSTKLEALQMETAHLRIIK
ncbi:hypothetical protein REC12_07095 [Desulfosporosinus sp. PR]|uniref:hypothetical protein n=1 Tax=Candidatus Desulfosporosinus nitrosoreducens TaxID=3401928 RepID=UPI0027F3565D|nr:hypothetical protein [Desulfosporosinus sp. PR]MDQ7093352.1 hypothetical protein [Desulfosporosinus sp. PR]